MPKNLLLADDSITIQKVVSITFAGEDFSIVAVDNGHEALERARAAPPDIILADVVMPRKNGYELCEAVKADAALRDIPVLLLAGTFEAFDEARARAAGADAHIAKPFESQALVNKVKDLLATSASRESVVRAPPAVSRSPLRVAPPLSQVAPASFRVSESHGPAPAVGTPTSAAPSGSRQPSADPLLAPSPAAELDWSDVGVDDTTIAPQALSSGSVVSPPTLERGLRPGSLVPVRPAPIEVPVAAQAPSVGAVEDKGYELRELRDDLEPLPLGEPIDLSELQPDGDGDLHVSERPAGLAGAEHVVSSGSGETAVLGAPLLSTVSAVPGAAAAAADGGEALLRDALSRASREVIERIAWEIVPTLAENIIREHVERLVKERHQ